MEDSYVTVSGSVDSTEVLARANDAFRNAGLLPQDRLIRGIVDYGHQIVFTVEASSGIASPSRYPVTQALQMAINIIENYQMDIRNLELPPGAGCAGGLERHYVVIDPSDSIVRTLADAGFCQGAIYTEAIQMIKRVASGELIP